MSNFSNLSRQIVPYNITGLQDINVNTINGTTPFNGVVANTFYPLSFNTTTGILSQTPIGQSVETSATPTFNNINVNTTGTITSNAYNFFINTTSQNIQLFNNSGVGRVVFSNLNDVNYFGTMKFVDSSGTITGTLGYPSATNYFYLQANTGNNLVLEANDYGVGIYLNSGNTIQCNNSINLAAGYTLQYNGASANIPNQPVDTISQPTFNNLTLTSGNLIAPTATDLTLKTTTGTNNINLNIGSSNIVKINSSGLTLTSGNLTAPTTTDLTLNTTTGTNNINLNVGSSNIVKINSSGLSIVSGAIITPSGTLNLKPAGLMTSFNQDGIHGYIQIECAGTTTSGQVLFYTKEGTLRALMRADTSYFYFYNLASPVGCVYYTLGGVVFYCSYGQATGTGEIVFKDNNIEVFTANAVNGLTMKNSNVIQSVSGTPLNLNAPTGQLINFKIAGSTSCSITTTGLSSPLNDFYIQNTTSSVGRIILKTAASISVVDASNNFIVLFNFFGGQIYYPYFSSGYYAMVMQTSALTTYYYHYINGTTYQITNSAGVGVQLTYGGTSWGVVSDIRLKKNIQPLKNSLELINQLNPITYNWKDESLNNNNIGFIAQEVEKVIPEITEDYDIKGEKYLGMRTTDLIPFLVKSIQELSKELNDLKNILIENNLI